MKTFEELIREKEEERRRKEEEYARWRMKNLGECYSSRLDYDIGEVYHGVIGEGIQNVLKPGDKVAVELYMSADPCLIHKRNNEVYVEGFIPVISERCKCSDIYVYEIYSLPLHIRGILPRKRGAPPPPDDYNDLRQHVYVYNNLRHVVYNKFVVYNRLLATTEYKGNGTLEIIPSADENDYDYYLSIFTYVPHTDSSFDVESVTGAVWYSVYDWSYSSMYNLVDGGRLVLSGCCDAFTTLIAPMLVRRGEEARIRFAVKPYGLDEERYEAIITAAETKLRELTHKERRKEYFCGC